MKKAPISFLNEILHTTTGSLSLVSYLNGLFIEWKANEPILIADADADSQGDWSFVDTITKRQRTESECNVFGNPAATQSTRETTNTTDQRSTTTNQPNSSKPNILRAQITELKYIDVLKNGHIIRLISKSDGKVHSEYLFQHGNADGFVRAMQASHCLQRSRHNKNQFEIVENFAAYDKEKLQKTFSTLKIEDIKAGGGGWISGLRNPLEHTIDFLAKMSDVYTIGAGGGAAQTSPTTKSDANNSSAASIVSSNNDEYEVLSNSPKGDNHRNLPIRPAVTRGSPLSSKQWSEFMAEDGRISDPERVKEVIFRGGIEHSLRREIWGYLFTGLLAAIR